jgi:hypothetical protein
MAPIYVAPIYPIFIPGLLVVGVILFLVLVLLILVLGKVGQKDTRRLMQRTREDIAAGRRHDVTVEPRPNDPWLRGPDDRLPSS